MHHFSTGMHRFGEVRGRARGGNGRRRAARRAARRNRLPRPLHRHGNAAARGRRFLRVGRGAASLAAVAAGAGAGGGRRAGDGPAAAVAVGPLSAMAAPPARLARVAHLRPGTQGALVSLGPAFGDGHWRVADVRGVHHQRALLGLRRAARPCRRDGRPSPRGRAAGAHGAAHAQRGARRCRRGGRRARLGRLRAQGPRDRRLERGHPARAIGRGAVGAVHLARRGAPARARAQPHDGAAAGRRSDAGRAPCRQVGGRHLPGGDLSAAHGHLLRTAGAHRDDAGGADAAGVLRHRLAAVPRPAPQEARGAHRARGAGVGCAAGWRHGACWWPSRASRARPRASRCAAPPRSKAWGCR